jgi:hypothetical protein
MDVEEAALPGSKEFGTFRESFVWKLGDLEGVSPSVVVQAAAGKRQATRRGTSL